MYRLHNVGPSLCTIRRYYNLFVNATCDVGSNNFASVRSEPRAYQKAKFIVVEILSSYRPTSLRTSRKLDTTSVINQHIGPTIVVSIHRSETDAQC